MRIVIGEVPSHPSWRAKPSSMSIFAGTIKPKAHSITGPLGYLKPHNTEISARFLVGMIKEAFVWDGLFLADYVPPSDEDGRKIRAIVELFLNRYSVNAPDTKT